MKRLLGKRYDDEMIQRNFRYWTFNVVRGNPITQPAIQIIHNHPEKLAPPSEKLVRPVEVSAEILKNLKASAERKTKLNIKQAIIAIPAAFNQAQINATKEAAKLADLEVLELLSEPIAAIYAYNLNQTPTEDHRFVVVDFGGGTLDIAVVHYENEQYNVIQVKGDAQLGGRDVDNILLDYFIQEIKARYGRTIPKSQQNRFLNECIDVKHTLSNCEKTR